MDTRELIVTRLTHELDLGKPKPMNGHCSITDEPITEGYIFSSYGKKSSISPLAACFVTGSVEKLGIERYAKTTPIGYGLCKIGGAKILIPSDFNESIEIWTGGKYVDRLVKYFKIVSCSGHQAKKALLERDFNGAILDMSLRIELILRKLRTTTPERISIMTESGVINVARGNWPEFAQRLSDLSKKERKAFLLFARRLVRGAISLIDDDTQKTLREKEDTWKPMLQLLPIEPNAALFYLDAASLVE